MALFRKDRERSERGEPDGSGTARPRSDATDAPQEVASPNPQRERLSMPIQSASSDRNVEVEQANGGAYLGRGTRINGKIAFDGPARIEGQIEGEIVASESLLIGEAAVLNAQVSGVTIVIHGKVTGDINASKKLEIRAPGRVFGNVTTPSLVIEEGVVFEGHCSMGVADTKADRKVTLLAKEEKAVASSALPALKIQGEAQ
jgi:cytoskeletal protein CcmA (bactofilin family)